MLEGSFIYKEVTPYSPYQSNDLKKQHWIKESLLATLELHEYYIYKSHPRGLRVPKIVAENLANKISCMKLQSLMQQQDLGVSSQQLQEKLHCFHENSAAHWLAIDFPAHCDGVELMVFWCLH